ncbi:MAG: glycoside hydrolase family 15 protein [Alphaproteobacteria bacterium]|nr:glycoside hydrolase family 15 protein [Alphaproteobacteria bacterium]
MTHLNLGVIGNCNLAMLIDNAAHIVWGCFPRLDGVPIFNALVGGEKPYRPEDPANGGYFVIELANQLRSEQFYTPNTAVLCTRLYGEDGSAVEVVDFAPRYPQYDRMFRPPAIVRRIFPLNGKPRLRVRLRPRFGWGNDIPRVTLGSNHMRFVFGDAALRLTTDAPLSYIAEETPFLLDYPVSLILGSDESLMAGIEETARIFHEKTLDHWRNWVRSLSIPFDWQEAVIRAAITLKLCNYEETGAIVAALTTSIPEAPNTQRNWDYRLCWPRDAYFVIHALNRLGATRTMEEYLGYITNIVSESGLQPVYGITRSTNLDEKIAPALAGYRGMGPVRLGNQAYEQVQNDVYGSVVLAATHVFFDQRLPSSGNHQLFERLEMLGRSAVLAFDKPDAGLWELRGKHAVHTFSSLMCWAACDRLSKIAGVLGLKERAIFWRVESDRLHETIVSHCWNEAKQSFVSTWNGAELDASLLLMHELDFLMADDPRFALTVDAVGKELKRGDLLLRYAVEDDFGLPETAFTICTFWYIDALASLGRREEALAIFESILARRNPLGLLSEDIHPLTGELWGNFPQAYSMVGLINAAMRLSRSWEEVF